MNIESPRGTRYFLVFKVECTSFRKCIFSGTNRKCLSDLKNLKLLGKIKQNKITVFRSDNRNEYTADNFQQHLKENGIIQEFLNPYIHEQKGRAESAGSIIIDNKVSLELWPEVLNKACYLLNRTIQPKIEMQTPFDKWFG